MGDKMPNLGPSTGMFIFLITCLAAFALFVGIDACLDHKNTPDAHKAGDAVQVQHKAAENINSVNKLRKVILKFEGGKTSEHLVLEGDVDKFVDASIRLHHDPGVNPHNAKKAARVETICVSRLRASGPFWWSTPDLKKNSDPSGAVIFRWQPDHCAFPRVGSQACAYCEPYIGW